MTKFNFRLIVNDNKGSHKLATEDCHTAKSIAGRLYRDENVKSVCVVDTDGDTVLYMVKGKPEKFINIPSEIAELFFL